MSKDEEIEKIENTMIHAVYGVSSPASYKKAKAIYDAGFRDVGELKEWVIEVRRIAQEIISLKENKISEVNYDGEIDFYKGKVDAYLRVLESL